MKVNDSFWPTTGITSNGSFGGIYSLAVASIKNELDNFMNQLPANLKENRMLTPPWPTGGGDTANVFVKICCGHTVPQSVFVFLNPSNTAIGANVRTDAFKMPNTIACKAHSQSTMHSAWFRYEFYPSLTFISILHIALAIIKAFRLLCLEDQAWDLNVARTMYNLPGILQHLSKLFEDASSRGSSRSRIILHGRPIFSKYAEAYRGIERWYLTKLSGRAQYWWSQSMHMAGNMALISGISSQNWTMDLCLECNPYTLYRPIYSIYRALHQWSSAGPLVRPAARWFWSELLNRVA